MEQCFSQLLFPPMSCLCLQQIDVVARRLIHIYGGYWGREHSTFIVLLVPMADYVSCNNMEPLLG